MNQKLLMVLLGAAVMVTGCATKGYVRQTVDPVQAKVDQVADQTNQQGTELAQARQDVSRNTTAVQSADEKATAADQHAGEAMTKANQVDQKADQSIRELSQLRQVVASLDDYTVVSQTSVQFGFDRAILNAESETKLDGLVFNTSDLKRYFIAVEGYTDQIGDPMYNLELSKRRAEAVVQYLVGERDVEFHRIHTIGLGEQKPVDTGRGAQARANNRRVEVKIYSADAATAAAQGAGASSP